MSTTFKTKSIRDKKVTSDSLKTLNKPSGSMVTNNPLLGTFQTIESLSSSLHNNGRFRSIDESDSTGADCDSVSNNGSCSEESEDHKEKPPNTSVKQEIIPGADNDKREKSRLKNERKHQRQREKKAHDLHEKCSQFLMSRKLELLAQQLIAMGISHDRATYALMLNEGKLEESINWLFDDGGANVVDNNKKLDPTTSGNLKLDVSQEFNSLLELETKYKCTKQDVEKEVVKAEGDIEKAEEVLLLKKRKQDQSTGSTKPEETSDSDKSTSLQTNQNTATQLQPNLGMYPLGGDSGNQSLTPLDKIHMKLQWMKLQRQNAVIEENNRMPYQQSSLPRSAEESHYAAALSDQFKRLQNIEMREQVTVMQQQQQSSITNMLLPVSTGAASTGWYPSSGSDVVAAQANGYLPTRTVSPNDLNSNMMYQQLQYQGQANNNGHRMLPGSSTPVSVAPAASLGLFSGYGASGSTSGLDWNADGSMGKLDYNNIDWSLDKGLACPRPNQQYVAASPYETHMNGRTRTMANGNGMGLQESGLVGNSKDWTSPFEGKDLFSLSRQFVPPSL